MRKPITAIMLAGASVLASYYPAPTPATINVKAFTQQQYVLFDRQDKEHQQYIRNVVQASAVYRGYHCDEFQSERTARYAMQNKLPVRIVAALVVVESSCRSTAVSNEGAVGLMQVAPKTWRRNADDLLNPDTNMALGTAILSQYVKTYGLREGLHRYNGMGDPTDDYADAVLATAGLKNRP